MPENGLVISMVALSDCTSHIRSNSSTVSPSLMNHCTSSHSLIPSPVWASLQLGEGGGRSHCAATIASVSSCFLVRDACPPKFPQAVRWRCGRRVGATVPPGPGSAVIWQGRRSLRACRNAFCTPPCIPLDVAAGAAMPQAGEETNGRCPPHAAHQSTRAALESWRMAWLKEKQGLEGHTRQDEPSCCFFVAC